MKFGSGFCGNIAFRLVACIAAAGLGLALAACAWPPLGDTEAALALEDIAAGAAPSRLTARTVRPDRRPIEYESEGRRHGGDLYLSPEGARAGIVLVPGVVPAGKDDSRLVALAYTLARLRFAVLVPDLEGLRRYRVRSGDVQEVADAFRHLVKREDLAPGGRAGIAGFSYGAGPVILAGLEPDIRDRVHFLLALGGYHDLETIVTYFTTGYFLDPDGHWKRRDPHPYAKWVFTLSNTDLLADAGDRRSLAAYAREIMQESEFPVSLSPQRLAPDARAFYALLENTDPDSVGDLIESLSPHLRQELEGINPAAHDLSRMKAEVILVHGRGDTIIPYTESLALARNLPADRVRLFLIDGFAHVDVSLRQQDIPKLLDAMKLLLAHRVDEKP